MWIQKAEITDNEIKYNKLGLIKADELESGIADKNFVHTQDPASDSWEVAHKLNKRPAVTVVDSAGSLVFGDVIYVDDNNLLIKFNGSFKGSCYCN